MIVKSIVTIPTEVSKILKAVKNKKIVATVIEESSWTHVKGLIEGMGTFIQSCYPSTVDEVTKVLGFLTVEQQRAKAMVNAGFIDHKITYEVLTMLLRTIQRECPHPRFEQFNEAAHAKSLHREWKLFLERERTQLRLISHAIEENECGKD